MTDTDDLLQRLRDRADGDPPGWGRMLLDAADEIERLRAEVATLGRRYANSESNLAICDAALQTVQAELAALRKRVATCRCSPRCLEE